ncbi:hypothetical protein GCM10025770_32660 [Viridibacterium curvum]|uniref:Tetratricopeptide repeat protein n=2 Tax=Viridibacterium curvum TaxID=1101404 RepID=A0ABP9R0B9_9RHOO
MTVVGVIAVSAIAVSVLFVSAQNRADKEANLQQTTSTSKPVAVAELPDDIHKEITRLSEEGNALQEAGRLDEALSSFQRAEALLPPGNWEAGMWLLAAIGDVQFQKKNFKESRTAFMDAVKYYDDAKGNAFIRMRLGQSMLELGEEKEAENWLAGAYLMLGKGLFIHEDPKYLLFVKSKLKPPKGGWPDGW